MLQQVRAPLSSSAPPHPALPTARPPGLSPSPPPALPLASGGGAAGNARGSAGRLKLAVSAIETGAK
eukprot:1526958-Pyramimonas_sp.AAC.1